MNRAVGVVFLLLTFLNASASDAGFKPQPFVPEGDVPIEMIELLQTSEPSGTPGAQMLAGQVIPLEGRPKVEPAVKEVLGEKEKGKGVYTSFKLKAREEKIVQEDYKKLEASMLKHGLLYRDPALEDIVTQIATKVIPKPTDHYMRYRVYLLRDPSPNAFAFADGQIYVHTGMVARLENESQLAGILAHEASHVAGHHVIIQARSDRKKKITGQVVGGILGVIGGIYGGGYSGGLVSTISDASFVASMRGYSRDVEEEADRVAAGLLRASGFEVDEMAKTFEILQEDPEGLNPRIPTVWSSHPQLKDRAAYIRDMGARLPKQQYSTIVVSASEFRDLIAPLMLMTIEDYIVADYPRTALALAKQLSEQRPRDARVLMVLGNAWQALGGYAELSPDQPPSDHERYEAREARRRLSYAEREAQLLETEEGRANYKRNMELAKETYLQALNIDRGLAEAYRELGDVHYKLENYKESGRAYLQYLNMRPNAADRSLVTHKLKIIVTRLKATRGGAR